MAAVLPPGRRPTGQGSTGQGSTGELLAQVHAAVRRYFTSSASYAVLDANPDTHGGTWCSGGCGVAALALATALGSDSLWALFSHADTGSPPVPHHFVVGFLGHYVDADGVSTEFQLVDRWERQEHLVLPVLAPSDRGQLVASEVPGGWNSVLHRDDSRLVAAALAAQPGWPFPPR